MLQDVSIVVQDGTSFVVLEGKKRPIIVWSVVHCEQEVKLVHFSFRPDGLPEHRALAKYTARVEGGRAEVLDGKFLVVEEFEKNLRR